MLSFSREEKGISHTGRRLERQRRGRMAVLTDTVHAHDLAGKIESCDLLPPVIGHAVGFQCSRADGVDRREFVTLTIEVRAFSQRPTSLDDPVESVYIRSFQSKRKTDTIQPAVSTIN